MNAADYNLMLTNVEKYEAKNAGLSFDDFNIWKAGVSMRKDDGGIFRVRFGKNGRTFWSFRSALDFMANNNFES